MLTMEIGGAKHRLDPAAVSAIRYRAEYGDSIVNHLGACTSEQESEKRLLRLCRMMIPPQERPGLLEFAKTARRDPYFFQKAALARDALLAVDPLAPAPQGREDTPFDEYRVLALMAVAHMDMILIYELPILHLLSVAQQICDASHNEAEHELTDDEMAELFPRRG